MKRIHRWTKESRLNRRKTFNDVFDALMAIVEDLIWKWERLDTRVTTGSFRVCHETAREIFPVPYHAMKDRPTIWGRDEAPHKMVVYLFLCARGAPQFPPLDRVLAAGHGTITIGDG